MNTPQRSRDKHQPQRRYKAHKRDGGQLGRENQKPQRDKYRDLHRPCYAVVKADEVFLVCKLSLIDEHSRDVNGDITVAAELHTQRKK